MSADRPLERLREAHRRLADGNREVRRLLESVEAGIGAISPATQTPGGTGRSYMSYNPHSGRGLSDSPATSVGHRFTSESPAASDGGGGYGGYGGYGFAPGSLRRESATEDYSAIRDRQHKAVSPVMPPLTGNDTSYSRARDRQADPEWGRIVSDAAGLAESPRRRWEESPRRARDEWERAGRDEWERGRTAGASPYDRAAPASQLGGRGADPWAGGATSTSYAYTSRYERTERVGYSDDGPRYGAADSAPRYGAGQRSSPVASPRLRRLAAAADDRYAAAEDAVDAARESSPGRHRDYGSPARAGSGSPGSVVGPPNDVAGVAEHVVLLKPGRPQQGARYSPTYRMNGLTFRLKWYEAGDSGCEDSVSVYFCPIEGSPSEVTVEALVGGRLCTRQSLSGADLSAQPPSADGRDGVGWGGLVPHVEIGGRELLLRVMAN